MQYMKVEPSRLPTTNIFIQSFNFQMNTTITQRGGGFGRQIQNANQQIKLNAK